MKTRARLLVVLGLALLTLTLGAAPAGADNLQGISDTTIKIGNIGPYTGDASSFSALNHGPMAYFRYINSQGGVHGRKFEIAPPASTPYDAPRTSGEKPALASHGVHWSRANSPLR